MFKEAKLKNCCLGLQPKTLVDESVCTLLRLPALSAIWAPKSDSKSNSYPRRHWESRQTDVELEANVALISV